MNVVELLKRAKKSEDPFKADFRNFLYYCMTEVLGYGNPDPLQYDVGDWMQNPVISQDNIARIQSQALRGAGKSVIAACFCCYLYYLDPSIRILVVCSVAPKAEEIASLVKQIIDRAELLSHIRPNAETLGMLHGKKRLKTDKNTLECFDINGAGPGKDSSFSAYGVYGGYTGSHPDFLLGDDVEIPENSLTELKRDRLFGKMKEFESMVGFQEGGYILLMGTPQTEESVYDKCEKVGYTIRRWPAELPDRSDEDACRNVSPWLMSRTLTEPAGTPAYPERFPAARLLEKRAKGEAYYRLQMLLDTKLADAERYPLRLRNLIVHDVDSVRGPTNIVWGTANRLMIENPGLKGDFFCRAGWVSEEYAEFVGKVMYVDPKGGGGDTVGYAVSMFLRGLIFIPAAGGLAVGVAGGTSEDTMIRLARVAAQWGVRHVKVESNWGGSKEESAYARLLQPIMSRYCGPTLVETVWNTGQKERRILDDLEPMWNAHKIIVSEEVAKREPLMYQASHLTRDAGSLIHDDEIEAFWGACAHWRQSIVIDPEVAAVRAKEQEHLETCKEFEKTYHQGGGVVFGDQKPWKPRSPLGRNPRNQSLRRPQRWSPA